MIFKINKNINTFFLENITLLFFPGEKFSLKNNDSKCTCITVKDTDSEEACITVKIDIDGLITEYSESFLLSDYSDNYSDVISKAYYNACIRRTGYNPPWGMITGVRPSKLSDEFIKNGKTEKEFTDFLKENYYTQEEKSHLCYEASANSFKYIDGNRDSDCSLYVSIPFCPSKCSYCSFTSMTSKKLLSLIPQYLDYLINDINQTVKLIKRNNKKIVTVYIGGGTPTVLNEDELIKLLTCIENNNLTPEEFTVESGRPDTINREKLDILKSFGVNRICVNPQTMNDDILKKIGRNHSVKDFYDSYESARNIGFDNINIDLIAGLPGDNYANFCSSVDKVIALSPENITVHSLSVKRSSVIKDEAGIYNFDVKNMAQCIDYSQKTLSNNLYHPYYLYRQKNTAGNFENVGYSLHGHECLYNIFMMNEVHSVFACGSGAVTRLVNRANKEKIIERIAEPKYPYEYNDLMGKNYSLYENEKLKKIEDFIK